MRTFRLLIITAALTAALAATTFAVVIDYSTFNSDANGWALNEWHLGASPPYYEWRGTEGNPPGSLYAEGMGTTDNNDHNTREGAVFDKTFNTTNLQNIRIHYDIKTWVIGGVYGADYTPYKCDNDWNGEQLTVQYSTDGIAIVAPYSWYGNTSGKVWANAEWLRRGGGNGNTALETYNTGWGSRTIDLSGVSAVNNVANLNIRFRWQFNQGASATGGADWAVLDNIRISGSPISPADTTPPGSVTGFTATAQDGNCQLTWTNPSDADFAGVVLVVNGDHTPTNPSDGVVILDCWTFDPGAARSFNDVGRDPGRTYYYAIWTKDAVPNYPVAPQTATCTMSVYLFRESFETYANGDLEDVSSGQWVVDKTTSIDNMPFSDNVGQISVTNEAALDGSKSARLQSLYSIPEGDASLSHFGSFNGVDGLLHYHYDMFVPIQTNSGPLWYIDIWNNTNLFGRAYGWESTGAFRVGSNAWGNYGVTQNVWHAFDIIVDTAANWTRFYIDGVYLYGAAQSAGTGDTATKVRLYAHMWSAPYDGHRVYVDNVYVTAPLHPRVTSPRDNAEITSTLTPTVTWSRYAAAPAINHRVRICTGDDPESTSVWDSGVIAGGATSAVTGTLPNGPQLYAFAREETASGWGYWSPVGTGGFHCAAYAPSAPTVTAPSVVTSSAKPMIVFTGDAHSSLQAKVATDSSGSAIVWDSGILSSTGFTTQSGYLEESTPYWAFVRIANGVGWSPWSTGLAFTVDRSSEWVDIRHMDEPDLLTADDPGPNDGIVHLLNSGYNDNGSTSTTVGITDPVCGDPKSIAMFWNDAGPSRSIRMHKIGTGTDFTRIDLDKGVTFVWSVAVLNDSGNNEEGWGSANALLADKRTDGTQTHVIAIRTLPEGIGVITNDASAGGGPGSGFSTNWAAWPTSTGYRVIRLTGRNQILGDYTSTLWKVYVNESLVITATGSMTGSIIEGDPSTWPTDFIALGHGSGIATGEIRFDWIAVNCGADYAPGQWDASGLVKSCESIGEAKLLGTESHAITIARPMVITKVLTHEELIGVPPEPVTVQDGFYAQDVAGGMTVCGVFVATSDTNSGAVAPGAKITSLTGAVYEESIVIGSQTFGRRTIQASSFTIEGTAPYAPTAMAQKNLMGPCIDQNLGGNLNTTEMLVRIFGKVNLAYYTGGGNPCFYVDDGSGAVDGRDETSGIRIVLPIDAETIPEPGDYVVVEGICVNEIVTGGTYNNVRTLLYSTVEKLVIGIP